MPIVAVGLSEEEFLLMSFIGAGDGIPGHFGSSRVSLDSGIDEARLCGVRATLTLARKAFPSRLDFLVAVQHRPYIPSLRQRCGKTCGSDNVSIELKRDGQLLRAPEALLIRNREALRLEKLRVLQLIHQTYRL